MSVGAMAEDKELIGPDDDFSSEEEGQVHISSENHPTGASKAADLRRERRLCVCVLSVMVGSVVLGLAVALTVFFTIRHGYTNHSHATTLSTNVSTVERSGDWVLVKWEDVDQPSASDWIGLYSVPDDFNDDSIDPTERAPIKFQYASYSETHLTEGHGSIQFRLINIRQPLVFSLFRGGLDTSHEVAKFSEGTTLAVSGVVQFQNWNEPLQTHLALTGNSTEMIVVWVTRDVKSPEVKWGTKSGQYTHNTKAKSSSYNASDMCGSPATDFGYRSPGLLHQATLTGLQPGLTYYYQCGDEELGWSQEFHFSASPLPDPKVTTRIIVLGDMGNGHVDNTWQVTREQPGALNTTDLLRRMVNDTDAVFHIGDISYARGYANVWDEFFDEIQSVSANVPYMVCIGNHERNWNESTSYWKGSDSKGECGVPYELRFPMPRPSLDEPWYSVDYGSVHFLIMSTEHDFTIGSVQYQFLENDLRNVNKSTTPWLVLAGHRPMYAYTKNDTNRYAGVQPVAKLLRDNLEELLQNYSVDLAMWGHEHAYQRSCPLHQEQCVEEGNGTIHVIVGMAGQKHSSDYPKERPLWLKHFDRKFYGLSRITANQTNLVLDYIVNDGGIQRVNDTLLLPLPLN